MLKISKAAVVVVTNQNNSPKPFAPLPDDPMLINPHIPNPPEYFWKGNRNMSHSLNHICDHNWEQEWEEESLAEDDEVCVLTTRSQRKANRQKTITTTEKPLSIPDIQSFARTDPLGLTRENYRFQHDWFDKAGAVHWSYANYSSRTYNKDFGQSGAVVPVLRAPGRLTIKWPSWA